jgi:hypothetical protein
LHLPGPFGILPHTQRINRGRNRCAHATEGDA